MKTMILSVLSVIIIMIMSLTPDEEPYKDYEKIIAESQSLNDSALLYLKELHKKNDSLLDKYFPIDEEYNKGQE